MASAYRLDFFDDLTGSLRAQLTGDAATDHQGRCAGFRNLSYTKRVNAAGLLQFVLRGDHEILREIDDKWIIEVWRKPEKLDWYRDFTALYRQPEWSYGKSSTFVGLAPGINAILSWEKISWPADTTNRTRFIGQPAETIAKTIVEYNRGAGATEANGRKADGVYTGLTVEADQGRGNNLDYLCFDKGVLEALRDIASVGGGDFSLERTGALAYEFRWHPGQLGEDRSGEVVFSIDRNNMTDISYREKRMEEATLVYVWGQGEKDDRDCVVVASPDYSTTNHHAISILATDVEKGNLSALQARGEQKLRQMRANSEFEFSALQQPGSEYGVDYGIGCLITAVNPYNGAEMLQKVEAATVSFAGKKERVEPEFVTP